MPENITFITYARLMTMEEEDIAAFRPDLIILDEFHRCGAEQWGAGIQTLLAAYPNVPILGLSATNIRFLDNQRDMADELFDGHIASEITLGEAIARNILKPPKYVLSVYSFQKDMEKYEARVEKLRNPALRDMAEDILKSLRRNLEDADGLDAVFARHMPDAHGKYIAFCSGAAHMDRMIDQAPAWFAQVDAQPHIYRAYSPDPATREAFEQFRRDESGHIKILYTIDMLNEGIHVTDVDGVILFRPTVSPIIYKQQIGRALSAGSQKTPVIFDVVNNIENLTSIGALEREFEEAVLCTGGTEQEKDELRQRFQIIDEVRDCRELFERLNDALTVSWDGMYACAKAYYEKHGDLNVPGTYRTGEGYSLGTWILTQRAVRKGLQQGSLSEERIAKLDEIGMLWSVREQDRWREYYGAAQAYARTHGHLCVPAAYVSPEGVKLGEWLSRLKIQRNRGGKSRYLTEERIALLDGLGMVWDADAYQWECNFKAACRYYEEHGNLEVPSRYITPDGVNLGTWIQCVRRSYKKGRLDAESIRRLEAIGMLWNMEQAQWERQYRLAERFYHTHGHLDIPSAYVTEGGVQLGQWLQRMRQDYKKGALEKDRIERLERIGITWDVLNDRWEMYYETARRFYREHGNLQVAPRYVSPEGIRLGVWIQRMRAQYKKEKLTAEQIERLESIGMVWDGALDRRRRNYQSALEYYHENGDLNVPPDYVTEDDFHLGRWVQYVRKAYRDGKLDGEQIQSLERMGITWDPRQKNPARTETGYIPTANNVPAFYFKNKLC